MKKVVNKITIDIDQENNKEHNIIELLLSMNLNTKHCLGLPSKLEQPEVQITVKDFKHLDSSVHYFKNTYYEPIVIDLLEIGKLNFMVRLQCRNLKTLKAKSLYFWMTELLLSKHIDNYDLSTVYQKVKETFRALSWENAVLDFFRVNEQGLIFKQSLRNFTLLRI